MTALLLPWTVCGIFSRMFSTGPQDVTGKGTISISNLGWNCECLIQYHLYVSDVIFLFKTIFWEEGFDIYIPFTTELLMSLSLLRWTDWEFATERWTVSNSDWAMIERERIWGRVGREVESGRRWGRGMNMFKTYCMKCSKDKKHA